MSRHRNVRSMNYSDEYDGYDDVYGHSVEDDYCVSPSAEQFLFDRDRQHNISSYMTEDDIAEEDETQEETLASSYKRPELSVIDAAKLESCIEIIKNVVGDSVPDSVLTETIIKLNFNSEAALDAVLKTATPAVASDVPAVNKNDEDLLQGKKLAAKPTVPAASSTAVKVTPSATRSIVKGFEVSVTDVDLLHAKVESPRSLSPLSKQSFPDDKRKDVKTVSSRSNSPRCQSPATDRATLEQDLKSKSYEKKQDALSVYKNVRGDTKELLHLVVVGHVDAGKSTLLGRLLCDLGQVSSKLLHKYQTESKKIGKQSFAYAWVLDETGEERERGITMDVGHSKFETPTKFVTLLDAPGHKDFIPNMITGATQADVALLVVDATRGEFESGFESGGQTREHALLLRSIGVSQLAVVINKLDTVDWSKDRFDEIVGKLNVFLKQAGFRDVVTFVPCSGLSGENLVSKPKEESLLKWYKGPTLVEVIDQFKCPERPVDQPFRFSVNDIYKGTGSGFCVSGHVETGMVTTGDKVLVLPHTEVAFVKGLQIDEMPVTNAFAGDQLVLTLTGIDQQIIAVGDVLCDLRNPVRTTTRFQAHIVIFSVKMPITRGLPVVMHQQSLVEPAVIKKLIAQLHKSSGEIIKNKPRCLPKNSSAIVEIQTQRPICMELYRDVKQLGRVMLRVGGSTIAAGLVTKIY